MKAVVAAFNQEKALVGAFSVITNLRMELFQALVWRERSGKQCSSQDTGHNTQWICIFNVIIKPYAAINIAVY